MVKAAVLYQIDSDLEIVDLSISSPKDKEVLISMDSAGLCASDLHVMKGEKPLAQVNEVPIPSNDS